jgi:hypothetical protein
MFDKVMAKRRMDNGKAGTKHLFLAFF